MLDQTYSISSDIRSKIVFLGDMGTGKTSIIQRYVHNRYVQKSHPTVGIDFLSKKISSKTFNYRLQLWDTAGQQRYKCLIPSYIKDASYVVLVFDITNKVSFESIPSWFQIYQENRPKDCTVCLIGSKADLQQSRQIPNQQAQRFCKMLGMSYNQVSSKTGAGIQNFFQTIVQKLKEESIIYELLQQAKPKNSKGSTKLINQDFINSYEALEKIRKSKNVCCYI